MVAIHISKSYIIKHIYIANLDHNSCNIYRVHTIEKVNYDKTTYLI